MHAVPHAETNSELISGVSVFFRIVFAETHAQTNSYSKRRKKKKTQACSLEFALRTILKEPEWIKPRQISQGLE